MGSSADDGLDVRLTASVGVATLPDVAASAEELIRRPTGDVPGKDPARTRASRTACWSATEATPDRGAGRHVRSISVALQRQGVAPLSLRSVFSLFSSDLAIDLGTANTLRVRPRQGHRRQRAVDRRDQQGERPRRGRRAGTPRRCSAARPATSWRSSR